MAARPWPGIPAFQSHAGNISFSLTPTMRRSASHLYVLDSMGLPPAIGLGLALGLDDSTFEKIVVLEGAFHGRTLGALAATPRLAREDLFGPLPAGFAPVSRDDPAALRAAVGERTAAVMIEPIQGEAGIFPIADEVLLAAREACDVAGALLTTPLLTHELGSLGKPNWRVRANAGEKLEQADIDDGHRDGLTTGKREELAQLRRENRRLTQDVEILKRATAFFAKETR